MTEEKTKRIIVYHDTQQQAHRARKPAPGESMGYAAIVDWNPEYNATFDEVIDLSSDQKKLNLPDPKTTAKKGKGNDV